MSDLTPAQTAAELVVDRCLPIIQGKTVYDPPATPPIELAQEQRNKLGLDEESETYFYAAGETGVFLDVAPKRMTVWFNGADCDKGMALFDRKLMQVMPRSRQIGDIAPPATPGMRARMYEVDLGAGLLAWIEISYPGAGAKGNANKFVVRIEPRKKTT